MTDFDQVIPFIDSDGDDPVLIHVAIRGQLGFLHRAVFGRKENVTRLFPRHILALSAFLGEHPDQGGDFFAFFELEEIGNAPAFGGAAHVRDFMNPLDIDPACIGEEHQVIMSGGGEKMFDKIILLFCLPFFCCHANDAFAPAFLGAVTRYIGSFNQSVVSKRDNDPFIGNQILDVHLAFVRNNLRAARGGVLVLDELEFGLDHAQDAGFLRQNVQQVGDFFDQLGVFLTDFFTFQTGELIQAKLENRISLGLAECIPAIGQPRLAANEDSDFLHLRPREIESQQFDPRLVPAFGVANDFDEFIQMRQRDQVSLKGLGARLGILEFMPRAANDDLAAVLDVTGDDLLDIQRLGFAVIDRQHVGAE